MMLRKEEHDEWLKHKEMKKKNKKMQETEFESFEKVLKMLEKEYIDNYEKLKFYPLFSSEISRRERDLIKFEKDFTGKTEIHDKIWLKYKKVVMDKQEDYLKTIKKQFGLMKNEKKE